MLSAFTGVLSCLDGYMNIALEQTEEHVGGTLTNRYGDAFIRGNNGACSKFKPSSLLIYPQCCTYLRRSHYNLCVKYCLYIITAT